MSLQDDIYDVRRALKGTQWSASFDRIETALNEAENAAGKNHKDAAMYRQILRDVSARPQKEQADEPSED